MHARWHLRLAQLSYTVARVSCVLSVDAGVESRRRRSAYLDGASGRWLADRAAHAGVGRPCATRAGIRSAEARAIVSHPRSRMGLPERLLPRIDLPQDSRP